jgi:hypothetical protein
MAPDDPLFAIRVVSEGPGFWTQALPVIIAFAVVALGAVCTYLVNVKIEQKREARETRQLAHSIVAEVRAGRMMMTFIRDHSVGDLADREDTLRFVQMPSVPMPITTEAAKRAGRFVSPVAQAIATQLVVMASFKQYTETTRNMQNAGVLTLDRYRIRAELAQPLAHLVADHALVLEERITENYPLA